MSGDCSESVRIVWASSCVFCGVYSVVVYSLGSVDIVSASCLGCSGLSCGTAV